MTDVIPDARDYARLDAVDERLAQLADRLEAALNGDTAEDPEALCQRLDLWLERRWVLMQPPMVQR